MDFKSLVCPQPSMLNTSNAQANPARRVLRFTAIYLQKEILAIVAASVTSNKVTKVTAPHWRDALSFSDVTNRFFREGASPVVIHLQSSACLTPYLINKSLHLPPSPPLHPPPTFELARSAERRSAIFRQPGLF